MEDSTREWVTRVEHKIDTFSLETTKILAAITTKLDILLSDHKDIESRVKDLEGYKTQQEALNAASDRRLKKWTVIIVGVEIIIGATLGIIFHYISK